MKYASIVLDLAIDKTLDYIIPDDLQSTLKEGMRVEVPLKGRMQKGFVFALHNTPPHFSKISSIGKVLSPDPLITPDLFQLAIWMAKYYCAPLHAVFKILLPPSLRKNTKYKEQLFVMRAKTKEETREYIEKIRNRFSGQAEVLDFMIQVQKGVLLTELIEKTGCSRSVVDTLKKNGFLMLDIMRIDRSPLLHEEYFPTKPKILHQEQLNALGKIIHSIEINAFTTHLLFGITGSGKTEVYLQALEKNLALGKSAIMLVPEISLTTQTIERFRSRFPNKLAILHHRLSPGERHDEWHRIAKGEAKIIIGARSAVFSPAKNLGLIIVDEEHETSYKQTEDPPCYHARDVAIMRAKFTEACVILGSATPSLESFYNAKNGKYILSKLSSRPDSAKLPAIVPIDMKKEYDKAKGAVTFSEQLLTEIRKRYEIGEQTILFLNRRGYHTSLLCTGCGYVVKCPHCDLSLTFHKGENYLCCHLCGYSILPPSNCPQCHSSQSLKFKGVGTEQVEKALHAIFPEIRTLRLDADTTRHKGSHQKILRDFGTKKADILIGTQMIAKGHHFPEVTLVGILNSDTCLHIPDFRSAETTFQLITQVAGRAGRGQTPGMVLIQTMMPENQTIQLATEQNFEKFYENEMEIRKLFHNPPYTQMTKISFTGENTNEVLQYAEEWRALFTSFLPPTFELLPLCPAGHTKIKGKYKFQFIIKGPTSGALSDVCKKIRSQKGINQKVRVSIDINPTSTYF